MTRRMRGLMLLAVQLALVLSIAGKYFYERKVCPRVWVRTAQFDPSLPLRGRYLALRLGADSCALPHGQENFVRGMGPNSKGLWSWRVKPEAREGKLVGMPVGRDARPEKTEQLTQLGDRPCNQAVLSEGAEYFIGDRAKSPFPLKPGRELWVEVTVPASGPPRPIQLAISDEDGFRPLRLR
jgi:hypothetical protein